MSQTDEPQDDGIHTEDLGYGQGANPQHAGGLGATLPGTDTVPTGTGSQVDDDVIDDGGLATLPEGSGTPSTKPTTNTSSGSPSVNSPGPNA